LAQTDAEYGGGHAKCGRDRAGGGFGRAIAAELAGRGYFVQVTDVDAEAAARTAAEIGGAAESAGLEV
jgi:2-hydroxycyclohexanecarboxyl-CoA dehydrogenase